MEPKFSRDAFVDAMRQRVEETLGQIADVVNDAKAGKIIADSEEKVRDLFASLRQSALRAGGADASESGGSRFSPLHRTRRRKSARGIRDFRTTPS